MILSLRVGPEDDTGRGGRRVTCKFTSFKRTSIDGLLGPPGAPAKAEGTKSSAQIISTPFSSDWLPELLAFIDPELSDGRMTAVTGVSLTPALTEGRLGSAGILTSNGGLASNKPFARSKAFFDLSAYSGGNSWCKTVKRSYSTTKRVRARFALSSDLRSPDRRAWTAASTNSAVSRAMSFNALRACRASTLGALS